MSQQRSGIGALTITIESKLVGQLNFDHIIIKEFEARKGRNHNF